MKDNLITIGMFIGILALFIVVVILPFFLLPDTSKFEQECQALGGLTLRGDCYDPLTRTIIK